MIKYLLRTALFAAVGCLLLWFGIPQLHAHAPATYAALAANLTGKEHAYAVSKGDGVKAVAVARPFWKAKPAQDVAPVPSDLSVPSEVTPQRGLRRAEGPSRQVVAVSAGASGGAVTTNVYASLDEVPAGMQVVSAPPEVPDDPRSALNDDPGEGWAVVIKNAPYFDKNMRRLGMLPGGSVVSPRTVVVKDDVEVASCRIFDVKSRKWRTDYVVMRTSDLIRFDVPYSQTDPAQRDAVIDYFAVNGRLEALRERARADLPTNPYEAEYQAAKAKFEPLQLEINQLTAEMRRSEGAHRQRLMHRLTELRPRQTAALSEYNPIKERWQAWEREHPSAETAVIEETPEMRSLQAELDRMRPSVSFISGL